MDKHEVYKYGIWRIREYELPEEQFIYSRNSSPFSEEWTSQFGAPQVYGGMIKVSEYRKIGFCNRFGEMQVPCNYQDAGVFEDGLCIIRLDHCFGIIDTHGINVVTAHCQSIRRMYGLPGRVYETDSGFLVDIHSDEPDEDLLTHPYIYKGRHCLIDVEAVQAFQATNGREASNKLIIEFAGKSGIIDTDGKLYTQLVYDCIQSNGIASLGGHYGALDSNAREIVPFVFHRIRIIDHRGGFGERHQGDFILADRGSGETRVYTTNGRLLYILPRGGNTVRDIFDNIVESRIKQLDEHDYLLQSGNYFGAIRFKKDENGKVIEDLRELVAFEWDTAAECEEAYHANTKEQPTESFYTTQARKSGQIIGPFYKRSQRVNYDGVYREGYRGQGTEEGDAPLITGQFWNGTEMASVTFMNWLSGIENKETGTLALPMEYTSFVPSGDSISEGLNNENYYGFTAQKGGRWYYIEIENDAVGA